MRVSLYFNPRAGGAPSLQSVVEELERDDYRVDGVVDKEADPARLLDGSVELAIAAGGDGTVSKVAQALAGSGVPIAILPLGTANNVARALGIDRSIRQVIASWRASGRVRFDLGLISGRFGRARFLEGIGMGLISKGIARQNRRAAIRPATDPTTARLRAIRGFVKTLRDLEPRRLSVSIDGDGLEGDYLVAEVLNVRSIGPNVELSPRSDPTDGWLDVVLATVEHRAALLDYLTQLARGDDGAALDLPVRRGREIELRGTGRLHVDDALERTERAHRVGIHLAHGAVEFVAGRSFVATGGDGDPPPTPSSRAAKAG